MSGTEAAGAGDARAPPPLAPPAAGDGDADSDEDSQHGAHCRLAARLALLALALLALGGPAAAHLRMARPCWSEEDGSAGREHWAVFWPQYAVAAPVSLALAAWCLTVRRRASPAVPLHAWTRRFGACAAVASAARLAKPALDPGCHGAAGAAWQGACRSLHDGSFVVSLVVLYYLLVLKLRALGLRRHERTARVALATAAAAFAACVVAVVSLFALGLPGMGDGRVPAALWWIGIIGFLVLFLALPVLTCCGVWGLLAAAARAERSRRGGVAQMARWVRGTAALVVASLLLLIAEGLLLAFCMSGAYDGGRWHAYAWASATHGGFNCLQVALLSGLAGPRSLRRLAVDAFERINCYSLEDLQRCYEEFLAYLDEAQVKWVRFGYLRHLMESGSVMVRCQQVPAAEAVIGSSGFPDCRDDPKQIFVLSHPWLTKEHPDPSGTKLQLLVRQLDLLCALDDALVFIDYMSLPQHNTLDPEYERLEENNWPKPGEHHAVRTEAEDKLFRTALGSMELMYSMSNAAVIVLPMDDEVAAGEDYFSRGWCFFEFCIAFSFGNIANASIHPPVETLCRKAAELKVDMVEGFQQGFRATRFTSKGDRAVVSTLFEQTLMKKPRQTLMKKPRQ
ncbi:unnamed protein product [Prorocentrum cordatum]|uniref:Uncharacterized protein n=1 Tax=Prorocentrum cordatum TaxID=2364126 RepID=A0ABN9SP52_9DINO|nr:unnamed protein product [Polarella glacialis]